MSSEDEKRLLQEYKYCEAGEWEPSARVDHALTQTMAVMAADQSYVSGLRCEVFYRFSPETGEAHWVFSIFKSEKLRRHAVLLRVYQLDILMLEGLTPNDHRRSHVHIGDERIVLPEVDDVTTFEAALERFKQDCTLYIDPELKAPNELEKLL